MRLIALGRPYAFLRLLLRKPPHRAMGFVPSLTTHDLNAFRLGRLHSQHTMGLISHRGSRCLFANLFGNTAFHFGMFHALLLEILAALDFWDAHVLG